MIHTYSIVPVRTLELEIIVYIYTSVRTVLPYPEKQKKDHPMEFLTYINLLCPDTVVILNRDWWHLVRIILLGYGILKVQ